MTAPESNSASLSILVAHGSRVAAANEAHVERCIRLDEQLANTSVRAAFLELTTPSVDDAIDTALADGFSSVTLHPFFLHDGKHTTVDLPAIIEGAQRRHPSASFRLGAHLGQRPELDAMLADMLQSDAR